MRRLILILSALSGLTVGPIALTTLSATPAFAGCGESGTVGSNSPKCDPHPNWQYGPGSHHHCWYVPGSHHRLATCEALN